MSTLIESLLDGSHPETHENANFGHTFASSFYRLAGEQMKEHCLDKMYLPTISYMHRSGAMHIHDLDMGIVGYCAGWSLWDLLEQGFNGVSAEVSSGPPKHLSSAMGMLTNFTGVLQNNWSGAMAFNSVDTLMAPFIARDNLQYDAVEQIMQEAIHGVNVSSRWAGQSPFVNWSFDITAPEDLVDQQIVLNGDTYGEFQDEMDMFNLAFLNVMSKGDWKEKVFTFPIPTYNLTKDFDWKSDLTYALMEMTARYGLPYFQNFINTDLDPREIRAMCCRLRLNMKDLYHRLGGTFGYGDKTGSVGVVTVNLPQLAYKESKSHSPSVGGFLMRVREVMDGAMESLEIKRMVVESNIRSGLLPWTARYLPQRLKFHFSTIGLIGMNEACEMLLGVTIAHPKGVQFAEHTLKFMSERLKQYQEETGHIYNLEESPAEGSGWKLARDDVVRCPGIVTAGELAPFYTNSSHLPVNSAMGLWEQIKHQERLQEHYTGGTVFHVFMGEANSSPEAIGKIVRRIAEGSTIKNFTITPTYSVCSEHGRMGGEVKVCPQCLREPEVYSRIVGYYQALSRWNPGRREEFRLRATFKSPL